MSSEGSVTQQANNQNNQNQNQANQIAKKVKKQIGLTAVGGLGGTNQGYIAGNLQGKDKLYYGQEAAAAAKKEMANAGLGTYNEKTGSFQNVVKDPKTGKMKIVNTGATMGAAMGTGEGTVMGQLPISKAMFEQQKKLQMMALAPLSLLTPFPVSTVLGLAANQVRKAQYDNYINNFNQGFIRPTSSYGITSSQSTQASSLDSGNAQYAGQTQEIAAEAERQKKLALSRKAVEAAAKRTFFGGKTRVIEGKMVGGL